MIQEEDDVYLLIQFNLPLLHLHIQPLLNPQLKRTHLNLLLLKKKLPLLSKLLTEHLLKFLILIDLLCFDLICQKLGFPVLFSFDELLKNELLVEDIATVFRFTWNSFGGLFIKLSNLQVVLLDQLLEKNNIRVILLLDNLVPDIVEFSELFFGDSLQFFTLEMREIRGVGQG